MTDTATLNSPQEIRPAIEKCPLTEVAIKVAAKRYFAKDEAGNAIEDWRGLVTRVVNHVCKEESAEYRKQIFDLIYHTYFLPNSPCLVNAGTPVGGLLACQPGWSRINTNKGLIRIDDLVRSKLPPEEYKANTFEGMTSIKNKWHNGKKEVLRFETEKGYRLDCTPDHRILIVREYVNKKHLNRDSLLKNHTTWVLASDIRRGDALVIDFKEKMFSDQYQTVFVDNSLTDSVTIDEDLARILAFTKCDGHLCYHQSGPAKNNSQTLVFEIIVDSDESLNLIRHSKHISGNEIIIKTKAGRTVTRVRAYGSKYAYLLSFGLFRSEDCDVPGYIFESPKSVIKSFLQASFDCEGTISTSISSKTGKQNSHIAIGMISENYIRDLQRLLNMFGIQCSIYGPVNDKRGDYHRLPMFYLCITNTVHLKKFMKEIRFINPQKNSIMDNYLSVANDKEYNKFAFRINKISSLGEHDVYDISTGTETYLSEGIVVHNCFVTKPVEDSWVGMSENVTRFGHIARRGGGCGVDFSGIRPEGDRVGGSTHSHACGPIRHMIVVSEAMNSITQAGFRGMACVAGDTMIPTAMGLIPIKEIVHKKLIGLEISTQFGKTAITNAWHNGRKELFEVITEKGYKVKLTGDHVVFVVDKYNGKNHTKLSKRVDRVGKWKKFSDLKMGDCLVLNLDERSFSTQYQRVGQTMMTEDVAALVAYAKCDGSLTVHKGYDLLQLVLDSNEGLAFFTEKTFGNLRIDTKPQPGAGGTTRLQKMGHKVSFLRDFGEFSTYHCDVPVELFRSPKSVVASFLRASFDAEGTVDVSDGRCRVILGMTSLQFVEGLQLLLSMFGIQSSLRRDIIHVNRDGILRHNMHYLSISNKWHVKKFMSEIGFLSERKNTSAKKALSRMKFGSSRGQTSSGKTIVRIKSVQSIGEDDVYDISTGNESFIANAVVVHNCMGVLRVDHPDIMSFITCKQHDFALKHQLREDIFGHYDQIKDTLGPHAKILLDKFLSNFNISVLVTSKFMKAVEADADFDLCFNGKTYRTIKALEIFNAVVRNAWRNGDPGMLFYEAMNNGPYKYSGQELTATNPCVTGESLVPTQFGWRRVDLLKVGDLIFTQGKLSPITRIEVNKDCHVFRVEFSDGGYVNATAAHRFKCVVNKQYKYLRLDEIGVGTKVLVENPSIGLMNQNPEWGEFVPVGDLKIAARDYGLIVGTVLGDGCFVDRNTNKNHVDISFSQQEQDWRSLFCAILAKYEIGYYLEDGQSTVRVRSNYLTPILERCGLERNRAPNKTIPADIFNCNNTEIIAGLLDGLFSTDGNMYLKKDNPMLRLSSSSLEMLRQVRLMLLSIGVHAKIYKSDRKPHDIDGRQISTQNPKYDLVIMNVGISKFHEFTKLSNQRKRDRIEECVKSYHYTGDNRWASIVNISETEHPETVYDVYVEDTDEWNVHGYVQQGCGEQMLPPFGSCNLGSIDVSKYYNPQKRDVDWRRLRADIRTAFRFLDCVIDINVFPTSEFAQWAKENRPVGLGIMGFADLLLKLRLSYGSPKSIEFAEKLIRFFRHESHKMSVELGQEKGTPKSCQFKELDFRRNATTLSIAPTGSISLLAGCSSSIEPVFAPMTYRYDNTGSYAMPHPESDKPYFRCALDKEGKGKREIKWQEHVAMQIAFQKHVDSGISKTINMPNSATEQDIAAAYLMAWKGGCKGLTIYRDGCKSAQVLNTKEKGSVRLGSNNAVERPATVPCDIFRATANGIEWHIIVGKVDNVPYELFAINGKHGSMPPTGYIVRNASRDYSLLNDDKSVLLPNIIEIQEDIDPRISLETRRFSLELRHGIHPKFITQQIDKSSETLTSFCKVVGRIFKHKYISDEEFIETLRKEDRVCPECKGTLISEACCVKCSNSDCSYSKCG